MPQGKHNLPRVAVRLCEVQAGAVHKKHTLRAYTGSVTEILTAPLKAPPASKGGGESSPDPCPTSSLPGKRSISRLIVLQMYSVHPCTLLLCVGAMLISQSYVSQHQIFNSLRHPTPRDRVRSFILCPNGYQDTFTHFPLSSLRPIISHHVNESALGLHTSDSHESRI
jgi:hypothetical protein